MAALVAIWKKPDIKRKVEGIVLHAFEGKAPFSDKIIGRIEALKKIYDLDLTADDSHKLTES